MCYAQSASYQVQVYNEKYRERLEKEQHIEFCNIDIFLMGENCIMLAV